MNVSNERMTLIVYTYDCLVCTW